eukprot:CAMPEP_0196713572 /NCGR_PEP_ID=MMETSP1090-20130531/75280_1 /TAXON_ID=37098 /ORGANISM="Isochrysis sp, Strain CCMP1244" /LENGTH=95 /DNA_ID=CAMNT_0042053675 /DNA_START=689 /DNA_END=976 /DNA_ORIENTATION=+
MRSVAKDNLRGVAPHRRLHLGNERHVVRTRAQESREDGVDRRKRVRHEVGLADADRPQLVRHAGRPHRRLFRRKDEGQVRAKQVADYDRDAASGD